MMTTQSQLFGKTFVGENPSAVAGFKGITLDKAIYYINETATISVELEKGYRVAGYYKDEDLTDALPDNTYTIGAKDAPSITLYVKVEAIEVDFSVVVKTQDAKENGNGVADTYTELETLTLQGLTTTLVSEYAKEIKDAVSDLFEDADAKGFNVEEMEIVYDDKTISGDGTTSIEVKIGRNTLAVTYDPDANDATLVADFATLYDIDDYTAGSTVTINYAYGAEKTIEIAFEKVGYTFTGYTGMPTGEEVDADLISSWTIDLLFEREYTTLTLEAKWDPNVYTVTFTTGVEDGSAYFDNDDTTTGQFTFGQAYNGDAPKPIRNGYTFAGYYLVQEGVVTDTQYYTDKCVLADSANWAIDGNITLAAKWTAHTYTIIINKMIGDQAADANCSRQNRSSISCQQQ